MNMIVSTAAVATGVPFARGASAATSAALEDAKLIELGQEFERLWAIETAAQAESGRLWEAADLLRYEKMGINPSDELARRSALCCRHAEWENLFETAADEVGYTAA